MKFAKLGFQTKEGISLGHFQDGWSMEYGEGGSYHVEVLHNGKVVAEVFEEGNGGSAIVRYVDRNHKAIDKAVLDFLARTEEDYGPNTKYSFCKEAIEKGKASDLEYTSMIQSLLDIYDYRKKAKNYFKKGYNLVLVAQNDHSTSVAASCDPRQDHLLNYAKKQGLIEPKTDITYLTPMDDLTKAI